MTAPDNDTPRFVTGSLLRHVCVMASTAAIGLIAVFAVDLINLFYISQLGEKETAAAIGFAGVVGFFHTSISIGLTIGITAVVSRTIGAGRRADARRIATASLVLMVAITAVIGSGSALFLHPLLRTLGATGETERLAARYLAITVHTLPLLGIGMACSALLRSVGDARRSMTVTLGAAAVTAVLDPILIFGFDMGLDGAAVGALLTAARDGVVLRGKAEVGDKTMIDAWSPAVDAATAAESAGASEVAILQAAADAAEKGAAATEPLVARKGRASYLGERAIGHRDPGSQSSALILRAAADAAVAASGQDVAGPGSGDGAVGAS